MNAIQVPSGDLREVLRAVGTESTVAAATRVMTQLDELRRHEKAIAVAIGSGDVDLPASVVNITTLRGVLGDYPTLHAAVHGAREDIEQAAHDLTETIDEIREVIGVRDGESLIDAAKRVMSEHGRWNRILCEAMNILDAGEHDDPDVARAARRRMTDLRELRQSWKALRERLGTASADTLAHVERMISALGGAPLDTLHFVVHRVATDLIKAGHAGQGDAAASVVESAHLAAALIDDREPLVLHPGDTLLLETDAAITVQEFEQYQREMTPLLVAGVKVGLLSGTLRIGAVVRAPLMTTVAGPEFAADAPRAWKVGDVYRGPKKPPSYVLELQEAEGSRYRLARCTDRGWEWREADDADPLAVFGDKWRATFSDRAGDLVITKVAE